MSTPITTSAAAYNGSPASFSVAGYGGALPITIQSMPEEQIGAVYGSGAKDIHRTEQLHLVVDSTGLKIYGEGEWPDAKHGSRSRRRWRKLHIGINANTHEVGFCREF